MLKALRARDAAALSAAIRNDMLEGGRYFVRHLEKLDAKQRQTQRMSANLVARGRNVTPEFLADRATLRAPGDACA